MMKKYSNPTQESSSKRPSLYRIGRSPNALKPEFYGIRSLVPLGNPAWTQPPWLDQSWMVKIQSREEATRETGLAAVTCTMCRDTDASVGKKLAAVAVVQRVGIQTHVARQEVIGWAKTCSVLAAELAAIAIAFEYADRYFHQTLIVLFSDRRDCG
jgi:hypothetical protein